MSGRFRSIVIFFLCCGIVQFARGEVVSSPSSAPTLESAKALFNSGKYNEARHAFGAVAKHNPASREAAYYETLCYHEMGDAHHFLEKAEKLAGRPEGLSEPQRDNLDRCRIEMLYKQRRFAEVAGHCDDFPTSHGQSLSLDKIHALGLVAKYERGYKKALDAANWAVYNAHNNKALNDKNWNNGTADLRLFLAGADGLTTAVLKADIVPPKRLQENIWTACVVLGENDKFEALIQDQPEEVQERAHFVQTSAMIQVFPDRIEENTRALEAYQRKYPNSAATYDLLHIAAKAYFWRGAGLFSQGEKYVSEANTPTPEETKLKYRNAAEARSRGAEYFELYLALCDEGLFNAKPTKASLHDRGELQHNYLYSLSRLGRQDLVLSKSREFIKILPRGGEAWASCRLYEAIALLKKTPPECEAAVAALDEIIQDRAAGGETDEHSATLALLWKIQAAIDLRDDAMFQAAMAAMKARPADPLKARALALYGRFTGRPLADLYIGAVGGPDHGEKSAKEAGQ